MITYEAALAGLESTYGPLMIVRINGLARGDISSVTRHSARHASRLDVLGFSFLGSTGGRDAMEVYFSTAAEPMLENFRSADMTYSDYVAADFVRQLDPPGDPATFFLQHAHEKFAPNAATELAWSFGAQGTALGVVRPDISRAMFERTYRPKPAEEWKAFHRAGLGIPKQQDRITYAETEEAENELFMAYCREVCPQLWPDLSA